MKPKQMMAFLRVAEHSRRVSLMAMLLVHEIPDVDFYKCVYCMIWGKV